MTAKPGATMARLLRWAGYFIAAVGVLVLVAIAAVWIISSQKLHATVSPHPETIATPTPPQLADAMRQARILGCFNCHGEGLAGHKMFDEPNVGTIWAPNLTQVAAKATDQQLARAIRQGVGTDGRSLFIMPSESFQNLSDQELGAIIALIRSLPRQGTETPQNAYGPLGRIGVATGKFKSAPALVSEYSTREPIRMGADLEPGRHHAILYCAACHNADLSGKEVGPGDVSPDLSIVGAYDPEAFKKLIRTGVPASGKTLPMMGPEAKSDLSHMNDAEIEELYAYLHARAEKVSR